MEIPTPHPLPPMVSQDLLQNCFSRSLFLRFMWWQVHGSEMASLCFLAHRCISTPVHHYRDFGCFWGKRHWRERHKKIREEERWRTELERLSERGWGTVLTVFPNVQTGEENNIYPGFPRLFNCSHCHMTWECKQFNVSCCFFVLWFTLAATALSFLIGPNLN